MIRPNREWHGSGQIFGEAGFVNGLFVVSPCCAQNRTSGVADSAMTSCAITGGGIHPSFLASRLQHHILAHCLLVSCIVLTLCTDFFLPSHLV